MYVYIYIYICIHMARIRCTDPSVRRPSCEKAARRCWHGRGETDGNVLLECAGGR